MANTIHKGASPQSSSLRGDAQSARESQSGPPRTPDASIEYVDVASLRPHPGNPRLHSKKQIRKIAESIRAFGFRMPVVIDASSRLISGHARIEACKLLGIDRVPALRVTDLSEDQLRGLMIADNRLSELSTWDDQLLGENLKILSELELKFDLETLHFRGKNGIAPLALTLRLTRLAR